MCSKRSFEEKFLESNIKKSNVEDCDTSFESTSSTEQANSSAMHRLAKSCHIYLFLFLILKFYFMYLIILYSIRSQLWEGLKEQTADALSTYLSDHDVQEEDPILVLEFLPYFDTVRIFPNYYCMLFIAFKKVYYIAIYI